MSVKRRKAGGPLTLVMPVPIPNSPENIAKVVLNTPPKRNKWKYMQKRRANAIWPHAAKEEGSV